MFHELSTIRISFEQFTDFNGVFRGFSVKILFLCTRETMCKPNAMKVYFQIAEAQPLFRETSCKPNAMKVYFQIAEAQPMLFKHYFII